MTRYAAFIRGIGPQNPNMANEKLRGVCEELGFLNVSTFISSGNVIFDSDSSDVVALEKTLEAAWSEKLGFDRATIIRSREELSDLAAIDPFDGRRHDEKTYLLVTFSRAPVVVDFETPHQPADREWAVVARTDRELFTVSDTTAAKTPDVMAWMERQFGKDITSRTWLTVTRILKRMRD